jgi:oxygen-dependent protoporphyrinogen oxidase
MQPELYDLPDEEIKKIVLEETADMLGTSGPPCLYRLARHGRAMPQYTLGHQDRVRQIEEQLAHHHGLVIASNALSGVGVPDCVRTARLAVQKLASQLKIN